MQIHQTLLHHLIANLSTHSSMSWKPWSLLRCTHWACYICHDKLIYGCLHPYKLLGTIVLAINWEELSKHTATTFCINDSVRNQSAVWTNTQWSNCTNVCAVFLFHFIQNCALDTIVCFSKRLPNIGHINLFTFLNFFLKKKTTYLFCMQVWLFLSLFLHPPLIYSKSQMP